MRLNTLATYSDLPHRLLSQARRPVNPIVSKYKRAWEDPRPTTHDPRPRGLPLGRVLSILLRSKLCGSMMNINKLESPGLAFLFSSYTTEPGAP